METLVLSLICGVSIGGAAGYLGTLMLSRRMALVAGPLGHLTLPGVALALLWHIDVSIGAFPVVILGVVTIWWLERRTRLPMEALTAIVFAFGVAVAFLFLPIDEAETALIGDISKADVSGTLLTLVAASGVVVTLQRAYSRLILGSISEELAAAEGIRSGRDNLLYLLLIAVIVALGVRMVGGLLTAALVAIPAACARNLAGNLTQYAWVAAAVGAGSAAAGILLNQVTALPAGPLVIVVSVSVFLTTLAFARLYTTI